MGKVVPNLGSNSDIVLTDRGEAVSARVEPLDLTATSATTMDSGGWTIPRRSRSERSSEDYRQRRSIGDNGSRRLAWGRLVGSRGGQSPGLATNTASPRIPLNGCVEDMVFVNKEQTDASSFKKAYPHLQLSTQVANVPKISSTMEGKMDFPKEVKGMLSSTRAGDMPQTSDWAVVHPHSTISEVSRALEVSSYVLLRDESNDQAESQQIVIRRMDFLKVAMPKAHTMHEPLISVVDDIPTVPTVHMRETLEYIFCLMLSLGKEEVAVTDGTALRCVITCQDIMVKMRNPHGTRRRSVLFSQLGNGAQSDFGGSVILRQPWADAASSINVSHLSQYNGASLREDNDDSDELGVHTKSESRAHRVDKDDFSKSQKEAQAFCTSWCTELLIGGFVVLDTAIGIAAYCTGLESTKAAIIAMCCIVTVFVYERAMRMYGFALDMLRHPFWTFDCVIVDFSALASMLLLTNAISTTNKTTLIMIRVLRTLRLFLIIRNLNLTIQIRRAVSSQKTRFREDGFDLDLTYVTKYCIAMSVPGLGTAEASYRNPLSEVQRFFLRRHPGHYLIFNLCKERDYDPALFEGQVVRIPVEDHNPPYLGQMLEFIAHAGQFMDQDAANCIAVHCKGGKGRTGIMICTWLMYTQFRKTATDAMEWFEQARTGKKARSSQGVSQPSQKRYVRYMESILAAGGHYTPELRLLKIVMLTCPKVDPNGGYKPWFIIENTGRPIFNYKERVGEAGLRLMGTKDSSMEFEVDVAVAGDVRIIFFDHDDAHDATEFCGLRKHHYVAADDLRFFLWFHTGFVTAEKYVLPKPDVDMACHDRRQRVFLDGFAVELYFERVPDPATATSAELGPFTEVRRPSPKILERSNTRRKVEIETPYVLPKGSRLEKLQTSFLRRGSTGLAGLENHDSITPAAVGIPESKV